MSARRRHLLRAALGGFFFAVARIEPLRAKDELKTDTPSINAIKRSLADRFALLKPHFEAGHIGLRHDGLIALRSVASLSKDETATLEALVVDDNKDRETLVREMARANDRTDLEDALRAAFAERWRDRAPRGWWLRDKSGQWQAKP